MAAEAAPARKRLRRIVAEDPPVSSSPVFETEAAGVATQALDRPHGESRALPEARVENTSDADQEAVGHEGADANNAEHPTAERGLPVEHSQGSDEDSRSPCVDQEPTATLASPAPAASAPEQGMNVEALLAAEEEKKKALQQAVLLRKLADLRAQNQELEGALETASVVPTMADGAKIEGEDSAHDTPEVQPSEPPPRPAPPKPPPKPIPQMAPSCWGLDEADDEAEAKNAEEGWPRGHADDMQIDPPIGLQGDIYAEVLWRLDWLLPRMDARTANQKSADYRDFSNVPMRTMPPHVPGTPGEEHLFNPSSGLPEGWTRMYSKSNPGKHYYFNKSTGKTSWVKPLF